MTSDAVIRLAFAAAIAAAPALLAGLAPAGVLAQQPDAAGTVTLVGVVVDSASGAAVRGAFLSLGERGPRAISDSTGAFQLTSVEPGEHRLLVQRFGYVERELTVTAGSPPTPLEIRLQPDPIVMEGLTVTGGARVALSGIVLDASTDEPLPWAAVWLSRDGVRGEGTADADDQGVFRLPDVQTGGYFLLVERLGYETQIMLIGVDAPPDPLEVRLEPDSAVLRGIAAFNRERRSRRNAVPYTTRGFDEDRLRQSVARGMRQFLEEDGFMMFEPCESRGGSCVMVRGNMVRPTFYIDELKAYGELWELGSYRPSDLYSVEIINCRYGVQVRAYTYEFVDRMARRPRLMFPPCL